MQGVTATDSEDGTKSDSDITHDTPVYTTTEAAFLVSYSVTDFDHNVTTRGGVVLVGDWDVASGYAISAHDFTKTISEVTGTEAEAISYAQAKAVDVRQFLADGVTPNPNLGKSVPVNVAVDGGYYGASPGTYNVTFKVNDPTNPDSQQVTKTIVATVGAGASPVITFTEAPLVITASAASHVMTADEIKAALTVTDAEDYPTWAAATGPSQALYTGMSTVIRQGGDSGTVVASIDTQNVGVYKVIYTATDVHGNTTTTSRAIVVNDGRYIIDKTDNGGIIIGARDFVIAQADVDGSESQAKGRSYAEAFDIDGDQLTVVWAGAPAGYTANAPAAVYGFTWQVTGYSTSKSINGTVSAATVVDPGTKNSKYALVASDFNRNTVDAQAMVDAGLTTSLVTAADAKVISLVPNIPVKTAVVVQNGDATTGPFSATQNTYPIRFGVSGLDPSELRADIKGVVSNGNPPALNVTTPLEITKTATNTWGSTYDVRTGVSVLDVEDGAALTAGAVSIAAGSDNVDTSVVGIYKLTYTVTDSDHNTVTAKRVVVVNDGTYEVSTQQGGRILKAASFVIKAADVTTDPTLKPAQILAKGDVVLYDGTSGNVINDTSVASDGGYTNVAADYSVTVRGVDPAESSGYLTKALTAKVVDADVIDEGPDTPPPGLTDKYYVYGKNITILPSQATALTTPASQLAALSASAIKVSAPSTFTDATATLVSLTPMTAGNSLTAGDVGLYKAVVTDAGSNASIELTITVVTGGLPTVNTPKPIVVPVDPSSPGSTLSRNDILNGVTASDPEDGNITSNLVINPDSTGTEVLPSIPADVPGVTQVAITVKDSDGNEVEVKTAVVVDDGSFVITPDYILSAKSYIIKVSEVDASSSSNTKSQILDKGQAAAWTTEGDAATAYIKDTGAYAAVKGEYFPVVGITNAPAVTKNIEAKVIDNDGTYTNGSSYSLTATGFRINLTDAVSVATQMAAGTDVMSFDPLTIGVPDASEEFIKRAAATSYLRTGTTLSKSGTPELILPVVEKVSGTKQFSLGSFVEGEVYLATFRVAEEPATTVTIEVLVSDGNKPKLDVPNVKIVALGSTFGESQYMNGVTASDVEDIVPAPITHTNTVNTAGEAAYLVSYYVTDKDHNSVSKDGLVLVGDWVIVGDFAIAAHDFARALSQVDGSAAQAISFASAKAVCIVSNNPSYTLGQSAPLAVSGYSKTAGVQNVTFTIPGTSSARTIVASISDDTPPEPIVIPGPTIVVPGPTTVINNTIIEEVVVTEVAVVEEPVVEKPTVPETVTPEEDGWALLNLIFTLFSVVILIMLIAMFTRRSKELARLQAMGIDRKRNKRDIASIALAALAALVAVPVLLLTESFTGPMSVIDDYTWMMAAFAVVSVIGSLLMLHSDPEDVPEA
jgi:uncharacterized membrane protein